MTAPRLAPKIVSILTIHKSGAGNAKNSVAIFMSHYSHAPIKEAIFDVRVAGGNTSVLQIDDALHSIRDEYTSRQELFSAPQFELKMTMGAPPAFNVGPTLNGFRYGNASGTQLMQARADGFSFNLLGCYENWENFSGEVRRLWEIYLTARQPQVITRVGLRYINHFVFAEANINLSEYFAVYPTMPANFFENANGFEMQISAPQTDLEAMLLLTQGTIMASPDKPALLLDIDVFREGLRWNPAGREELWNYASRLRQRKNQVFESCLKEPARELIR